MKAQSLWGACWCCLVLGPCSWTPYSSQFVQGGASKAYGAITPKSFDHLVSITHRKLPERANLPLANAHTTAGTFAHTITPKDAGQSRENPTGNNESLQLHAVSSRRLQLSSPSVSDSTAASGPGPYFVRNGIQLLQRINSTTDQPDIDIILTGAVRIDDEATTAFPSGVRFAGRNVTLIADNDDGTVVLDFARKLRVITVGSQGLLRVEGITFKNMALSFTQEAAAVPYQVQLALFPSAVFEPSTRYEVVNCTFYQYANDCSRPAVDASLPSLERQFGSGIVVTPGDTGPKLLLPNELQFQREIRQNGPFTTTVAGQLSVFAFYNQIVCQVDLTAPAMAVPPAPAAHAAGGDSGIPWWAWLLIGLGIASVLAVVAVALLLWRRRRVQRQQQMQGIANKLQYGHGATSLSGGGLQMDGTPKDTFGSTTASQDQYTSEYPLSDAARVALAREASSPEGLVLGKLIGRGGFGRVYKGRWKGVLVAVKVVDHGASGSPITAITKPIRESQLANVVSHPHVVATYQAWTLPIDRKADGENDEMSDEGPAVPQQLANGDVKTPTQDSMEGSGQHTASTPHDADKKQLYQTWIVCEYCDKGSLRDAIKQGVFSTKLLPGDSGPTSRQMVAILRTLVDVAAGMEYLHGVNLVHGDLKSANILLRSTTGDSRGFTAKIADFGLSRVLDMNKSHTYTRSYGTMAYQPPELLANGKLTKFCDVYAFAMLMWEIFSAQDPYPGASLGQVFYSVVYAGNRPAIPVECPENYTNLVKRCWHAEPLERPSFDIIHRELRSMLQTTVSSITVSTISGPSSPSKSPSPAPSYQSLSGK